MLRVACRADELREKIARLKGFIYSYIDRYFPGYLQTMDSLAWLRYSKTTLDLLVERPTALYSVLLEHYGDEDSADYAIQMIYLYPLALFLGDTGLQQDLLNIIKRGSDKEFEELLKRFLCSE